MELHSLKGPESQEGAVFTLSEFIKIILHNLFTSVRFFISQTDTWSDFIFFSKRFHAAA